MQQESADKFLCIYRHVFVIVTISTVSVPEGDEAVFDFHDAMIGNGDTMCITAKIIEYFLWAIKGCFGVDYLVFFPELIC